MKFLHKPCDGTELSQQNLQLCLGRHGLPFPSLNTVVLRHAGTSDLECVLISTIVS